jgi:hypothetical protein
VRYEEMLRRQRERFMQLAEAAPLGATAQSLAERERLIQEAMAGGSGAARGHGETLLRKQCKCKGTSSGPRFAMSPIKQIREGGNFRFVSTAVYAPMVCDVCEKPWKYEEQAVFSKSP